MFAQEPENSRVKGLTVTFDGDELVDFHVTRIAQDVAIMYSALELFDVLYRHSYAVSHLLGSSAKLESTDGKTNGRI